MIGIYKITSPSGKVYIGQSIDIKRRFKQYKSMYNSRLQIALHNSFKKYGVENHIFDVVEDCIIESLNERERYWQDYYDVLKKGLNSKITSTKCKSGKLSKETILKMSKSLKGKEAWNKGMKGIIKRHKISEETRIKLKKANTGRFYSEETKRKIAHNNPTTRIIIDLDTGVFYYSIAELARLININPSTLFDRLTGRKKYKNNTNYRLI